MRKSYVQVDGVLYEKGTEPLQELPYVVGDLKPYKSMADGSIIEGRAQHREHLRKHGCVEVGNETKHHLGYYDRIAKEVASKQRESRVGLLRAQFDSMTDRQVRAAVKRDADFVKWNSRDG